MTDGVEGRVIIVTGGGGAIGRGLLRHLGRAGASVVVAELEPDRLEAAIKELESAGVECLGVTCDVGRRASVEAMVEKTVATFSKVDGIVNNAMGIPPPRALTETTEELLDVSLNSGVKGTLWGMLAVYPHMKKAGWGRIVNVGSSAGLVGTKGFGPYNAAKEAIRALTRTAAREWAADGIVVNVYCPTANEVKGRKVAYPDHQPGPDEFTQMAMDVMGALSPALRDGDPEKDIGPVVAFLLSDACHYVTGQTLTIDGGTFAFA